MVALVPSHLTIGSVVFPLETSGPSIDVSASVPELRPLRLPLDQLVNGDANDLPIERLLTAGYAAQELSLEPTDPTWPIAMFMDGLVNWRCLSGTWPDPSDAMLARTGFIYSVLVLPKPVVAELVHTLRRFRHEIEAGQRAPRLDDTPVPPPPPLPPELARHEEYRESFSEEARHYREDLYARRR